MTALHALVLGVVQGLTEFLPISSSGHLILVPALLGWPDQGLAFDAVVHLGTSLALLCYFGRDVLRLGRGALRGDPADLRLIGILALGTVPAAALGLLLGHAIETRLRSATVVAWSTIAWALVLWWADRHAAGPRGSRVGRLDQVGGARGFLIGCAQAIALVPGTSRSGITLSAGLLGGLDRPTAARFAFLLGLPITAGAGLLQTARVLRHGVESSDALALAAGLGASFAGGLVAVWFLIRYLQTHTLTVFVVYRIVLGLLILLLLR